MTDSDSNRASSPEPLAVLHDVPVADHLEEIRKMLDERFDRSSALEAKIGNLDDMLRAERERVYELEVSSARLAVAKEELRGSKRKAEEAVGELERRVVEATEERDEARAKAGADRSRANRTEALLRRALKKKTFSRVADVVKEFEVPPALEAAVHAAMHMEHVSRNGAEPPALVSVEGMEVLYARDDIDAWGRDLVNAILRHPRAAEE